MLVARSCYELSVILPRGIHPFPSRTRKLSPAGPMVLHAPSVWERRSLPALNKGQSEKSDWPFPFREGRENFPTLLMEAIVSPLGRFYDRYQFSAGRFMQTVFPTTACRLAVTHPTVVRVLRGIDGR